VKVRRLDHLRQKVRIKWGINHLDGQREPDTVNVFDVLDARMIQLQNQLP
jgi:hypothetical protein